MAKIVDLDALKKAAQKSKTYTDESIIAVRNTIDTDIQAKQDQVDDALNTIDKTVVGAINELKTNKVDKTDDTLDTDNKTIVGAINELNYIVKNYQPPDDFDATVDGDQLNDLINGTFNNNE